MKQIPEIKREDLAFLFEDEEFPDGDDYTEAQREYYVKQGTHFRTTAGYIKPIEEKAAYLAHIKKRDK